MIANFCVLQKIAGGRHANVIDGELRGDCAKYQEGLVKAAQSNEELHRAMEIHIANLRVLSQPLTELQKSLPSPADIPRCRMLSRYYLNIAILRNVDLILSVLWHCWLDDDGHPACEITCCCNPFSSSLLNMS